MERVKVETKGAAAHSGQKSRSNVIAETQQGDCALASFQPHP